MKPYVFFVLAATGLVATSSTADERLMPFDGVGSMVLDMADEPVDGSAAPVATKAEAEAIREAGECEAKQDAFDLHVEAPHTELHLKLEHEALTFKDVHLSELADVGQIISRELAAMPMKIAVAEAAAAEVRKTAREAAILSARAAMQERREELETRIAQTESLRSRHALELAEKALKAAQQALVR